MMKTNFTLLICALMIALGASAQQPTNNSFDVWTDTLAPDGWSTYESLFHMPLGLATRDAADKVVGPYSLVLRADSVPGQPGYGVLPGLASYGTAVAAPAPTFNRTAFPYRPDTVFVAYKYSSPGVDTARLYLRLRNGNTDLLFYNFILDTASQWVFGGIVLTNLYSSATVPDSIGLRFYPSNVRPVKGSTLKVDGIFFGYAQGVGIEEVAEKLQLNVYPNPATDYINVSAAENLNGYTLIVTDLTGKIAGVQTLEGATTRVDVSNYANGVYTYRLADKNGNIIKQDRFNVVR